MNNVRKIKSMLIIGMFLATTICVYSPVGNVKAEEVQLDEDFIDDVVITLTDVANTVYWMGREFGSKGERFAAQKLKNIWDGNISGGLFGNAVKEPIDKGFILDGIDAKIGIINDNAYSLKIDDVEISPHSCYPYTNWVPHPELEYTVEIPPDEWYGPKKTEKKNIELFSMELEEELKKENILYEVEYVLLNNCTGISGEVAYISNYDSALINDTSGRIHLIDIGQNANDDVFNDKINNVNSSNGTAFIASVTNPSFINNLNTSVPGIAISRCDGEMIKQSLKNNESIFIDIIEESVDSKGTLYVYRVPEKTGIDRSIYLIDMDKWTEYDFNPRNLGVASNIWFRSLLNPFDNYDPAWAFLYRDINDDTHLMITGCTPTKGDSRIKNPTLKPTSLLPGFGIDGLEEVSKGSEVEFEMSPSRDGDVVSYNVIGTLDSPYSSRVVIISAHYDSYWGECAMDDATGVGVVWGVAKYIKDNGIVPKYDIKFIAFAGEEVGCRGANFYVWEHVLDMNDDEIDEDIVAVINLDPIGMNTKMIDSTNPPIPFRPWIHPKLGPDDPIYDEILYSIIDLEGYSSATGYPISYPWIHENPEKPPGQIPGGDLSAFRQISEGEPALADYLIELERYDKVKENWDDLSFFDHRSGEDFTTGDIWNKVDTNDLYETTKMAIRLVDYFSEFNVNLDFENDCGFTQLDQDGDGQYDSVRISYSVTANVSSGGDIESIIYLNGQPQTTAYKSDILEIKENETIYGNLTVTLPPNCSAGNCDIRVYLRDYQDNEDDFDNTTLYLYPYNHSIANFSWERNTEYLKMINFTDLSMPSPGNTLSSWNWSFGDGNYSNLQNCSHNYSNAGIFNVTLTVVDSANKSANITKQIVTKNAVPIASFNVSSRVVLVNETLSLNSTSSDVDGSIVNTTWYFGDNTTGYGNNITHSYDESGFYMVSLFATDSDNSTVRLTKTENILVVDALVDDGFTDDPANHSWDSIQEGINDVNDNDTIYVYNGSYNPYLVNKSISIFGENKNGVIINAVGIGIDVQNDEIVIKNFTITGGTTGLKITSTVNGTGNITIENGIIPGPVTYGVYIDNSSNNTIKNCEIDKADAGIKICNGAMYNVIDDCEIEGCYNGVGIYSSSYNWIGNPSIHDWYPNDCTFKLNTNAIYLDESDNNYILGCDIDAYSPLPFGTYRGIYLDEASNTTISTCDIYKGTQGVYIKDSVDSKIEFCRIRENLMGVEFFGIFAKDNLIVQNNITGNIQFGVFLPPDPSNNSIYYNDFISNGNPSGPVNQSHDDRSSGLMNIWEKTGNSTLTKTGNGEGNYWADYTGSDLNSDGIGDTPYDLDTTTRGTKDDGYPLMVAYGWCTGTGWD